MRFILKGGEPKSWIEHRTTPGATYNSAHAETMTELRRTLVTEQGGLCCYCMSRIEATPEKMKVEHWVAQSNDASQQLIYRNLLAACCGGMGASKKNQHCDTARGNKALFVNPGYKNNLLAAGFRYLANGEIEANSEEARSDIATLNLNLARLTSARSAVLKGLLGWTKSPKNRGRTLSRDELLRKVQCWEKKNDQSQLPPYCEVAIYWLRKKATQRP